MKDTLKVFAVLFLALVALNVLGAIIDCTYVTQEERAEYKRMEVDYCVQVKKYPRDVCASAYDVLKVDRKAWERFAYPDPTKGEQR